MANPPHHPGCVCAECGVVVKLPNGGLHLLPGESVTFRITHIVMPDGTRVPVGADDVIETTAEEVVRALPAAETMRCPACAPAEDEANHPPGMIFVGWGQGWQTCLRCNGTTRVPSGGGEGT